MSTCRICVAAALAALLLPCVGDGQSAPAGRAPSAGARPLPDAAGLGAGTVVRERKVSNAQPGFPDHLDDFELYGTAMSFLGDVDGDGVGDLAVGHPFGDTAAAVNRGVVWIHFLEPDGRVRATRRIGVGEGGFAGTLALGAELGASLAGIGDRDGNGVPDLAVGAPRFEQVFLLDLHADGTVKSQRVIRSSQITGPDSRFGSALASLGDLDGDGVGDLVVGSTGIFDAGAIHLLFLDASGAVRDQRRIVGEAPRPNEDRFGWSLAALGDVDGDGVGDLAVGSPGRDVGNFDAGSMTVLFLERDGTVRARMDSYGQTAPGEEGTELGTSLAALGDLDGDGVVDVAAGAPISELYAIKYFVQPRVMVYLLRADGRVRERVRIGPGYVGPWGAFGGGLAAGDLDGDGRRDLLVGAHYERETHDGCGRIHEVLLGADGRARAHRVFSDTDLVEDTLRRDAAFGSSVAPLGDLDGDGTLDVAVGPGDVWLQRLAADASVLAYRRLAASGLPTAIPSGAQIAAALANLGDLDGDGALELAVGSPGDVGGPSNEDRGEVLVLRLAPDGAVRAVTRIGDGAGGLPDALARGDAFGRSVCALGDLGGDGASEVAVGSPGSRLERGALRVLTLDPDGSVASRVLIERDAGGFTGNLQSGDRFATAAAALGDLDGDGVGDLAVGAPGTNLGGVDRGCVWVLLMNADGSVRAQKRIGAATGGFGGALADGDAFGAALASIADRDGDGRRELVVGAPGADDGSTDLGALWVLALGADGGATAQHEIGAESGGLVGPLVFRDAFGTGLAELGDLDGDGLTELGVGAPGADDGGSNHGALWLLSLGGLVTLDFETDDDVAATPLAHGRAVASPQGYARVVALGSLGANLGPAVLDSDRPADARGPDADLAVGRGNVLLLQDSAQPAQSAPGTFDVPRDDPDGGVLRFDFRRAIEARSVVLVDVDSTSGPRPGAPGFVALVDDAGRRRVYTVPRGWTGDRVTDGTSGWRTLDLSTLAPQRGFADVATAREAAGFDPRAVVRVDVVLSGSGAVDDLRFVPGPQ